MQYTSAPLNTACKVFQSASGGKEFVDKLFGKVIRNQFADRLSDNDALPVNEQSIDAVTDLSEQLFGGSYSQLSIQVGAQSRNRGMGILLLGFK